MRAHGLSWQELQGTPENVLDALTHIEAWTDKRTKADTMLQADGDG